MSSSEFPRHAFVIAASLARLREKQGALLIGTKHRHTLLARLSVRYRFSCPWRCVFTSPRGTHVALATRDKELQLIACGRAAVLWAIRLNLCDSVKSTEL